MGFFEQQQQRKNKQFISLFDSVLFISEHGKGSLEQALSVLNHSFLKKQTYLLLLTSYATKTVYVCSSYEQSYYEPYTTFEVICLELKSCIDRKAIGEDSPIYGLGFGKKRFVEQLLNMNMQIPEHIVFNTESPDITDADYSNESDELAFYQGLPKEYDTLRNENEKLKAQYQELWNKKELPETVYKIKEKILENNAEEKKECENKLDKALRDLSNLKQDCEKLEQQLEQSERKAELAQQMAERKILELENQLEQAKAKLADKPADKDKELNTKSQNYAAKIVLAMAQLADLNLDGPYAYKEPNTTNSIIFDQIKFNGMKVSHQVIGNWLKLAAEQTKDD